MIKVMRNDHWDEFDSKLMKGINLYIHRNTFHGSVREQESFLELLHNNFFNESQSESFPRSVAGVKNNLEQLQGYPIKTLASTKNGPRSLKMVLIIQVSF